MCHCQACRGACQKCALPQTGTVCGHFMPQVGAAGEKGQEDQALIDSAARSLSNVDWLGTRDL